MQVTAVMSRLFSIVQFNLQIIWHRYGRGEMLKEVINVLRYGLKHLDATSEPDSPSVVDTGHPFLRLLDQLLKHRR